MEQDGANGLIAPPSFPVRIDPSARQLTKVAAILLAMALLPWLVMDSHRPTVVADGTAGRIETVRPTGSDLEPGLITEAAPEKFSRGVGDVRATRFLASVRDTMDRYANLLIAVFTALLVAVAYMQNRLQRQMASDTSDALDVARKSADAATALAIAAAEANKLTRDLFLQENRPLVAATQCALRQASYTDKKLSLVFEVHFQNSGRLTAEGLQVHGLGLSPANGTDIGKAFTRLAEEKDFKPHPPIMRVDVQSGETKSPLPTRVEVEDVFANEHGDIGSLVSLVATYTYSHPPISKAVSVFLYIKVPLHALEASKDGSVDIKHFDVKRLNFMESGS